MMHVIKIGSIIKTTGLVMDSEYAVIDDGMDPATTTDAIAKLHFLNTVEVLKSGYENDKYIIKLVPVRVGTSDLLYQPTDTDKKKWYSDKAKPITDILEKFGKKLGIEVGDPSELSELQKLWMGV